MNQLSPRVVTLLQALITILLPIVITLSCIYIFISPQFLEWQYSRSDMPPADLFTPEARLYNSLQTVRYVRGEISLQDLENLKVYNAREIKHLVDVQVVLQNMYIIEPVALVLVLVAAYLLWRNPLTRSNAARGIMYGGILTIIFMGAIGLFSVFAFDAFFVMFHRVFFEGETWLFNLSDSLIQFYPEPFWTAASYLIALYVLILAVLVTLLGWRLSRQSVSAKTTPVAA